MAMGKIGNIIWHEQVPSGYRFEVVKASGRYRLFAFAVRTSPFEADGQHWETRYFLAEAAAGVASLEADAVARCTDSSTDERAMLALYSALVSGLLG